MTRIVVETKVKFTAAGGIGALLFVAAPAVLAFMALDDVRYGYGRATGFAAAGYFIFAGIAASLGLVLLLIGREYTHEVQVLKPGETAPKDNVPPFGGTEAERRNLGLK